MADITQFQTIADDDNLFEGYFNEIGEFYVERTDTNGSNYTHNAASWSLEQTFTFSGLSTNFELVRIEFDDLIVAKSSGNSADTGNLGVCVNDGTNFWAPRLNRPNIGGSSYNSLYNYWDVTTTGDQGVIFTVKGSSSSPITADHMDIPVPSRLITGVTSYNIQIYLFASQTAANTVTLTKGFTIRLVFKKRTARDLATSTSQA